MSVQKLDYLNLVSKVNTYLKIYYLLVDFCIPNFCST